MGYIDNFDLNQTGTIYARTEVNDGMGGITYTETARATISCAIWQMSASERLVSDRIHNNSTHKLACKPNSAFIGADIFKRGSDTYKISAPDDVMGYGDIMIIDMELTG